LRINVVKSVSIETTLDYAICHQGSFTRVLNVRVHRDNVAGVATDHRPLQVNIQTDCKALDDVHGESEMMSSNTLIIISLIIVFRMYV